MTELFTWLVETLLFKYYTGVSFKRPISAFYAQKEEIILKQIAGLAERFINPLDKYIRFLDKGEEIKALQDSSVPMPELIMPFSIEDKITEYKKN